MHEHLFGAHPKVYSFAIPVASIAVIVTVAVALPHLISLFRFEPAATKKKAAKLTRVIAAVPMVIAILKLLAIIGPRLWKLMYLVAAVYEVLAFWCFMQVILMLVVRKDDWSDEEVVDVLGQSSESPKMWATPPLACCFQACVSPREVRERDLNMVRVLMWQFICVAPLVALAEMSEMFEKFEKHLSRIETLSLVLAVYGLFSLLEATHHALEEQHSHAKFWTIKGTFLANTALFRLASTFVLDDERVGHICYSSGALAAAWAGMFTATLAAPLAVLSRHSFPPEDWGDSGSEKFEEDDQ